MRLRLWIIDRPSLPLRPRKLAAMRALLADTAERHRVNAQAILSHSRKLPLVLARQEAFYRARHDLNQSFPAIGAFFGRDHSTVIYGARRHAERLAAQ